MFQLVNDYFFVSFIAAALVVVRNIMIGFVENIERPYNEENINKCICT